MARRLNVPALAIAFGVVWGGCVLLMTWLNWISGGLTDPVGWFAPFVRALTHCYPWYGPSLLGGVWGAICGLVDGLIIGGLIAVIYNRLATPME